MLIRTARPDEIDRINVLRYHVGDMHAAARPDIFKHHTIAQRMPGLQHTANEMLQSEKLDLIVCEIDGEIAGFACVEYVIRPEVVWAPQQCHCYLREFGVEEAFQHKGVARALMDDIRDRARRRGIHRLELDVWEFNEKALHFYEKQGFRSRFRYMELDFE